MNKSIKNIFFKNPKKIEADFLFSLTALHPILKISETITDLLGFDETDFCTGKIQLKNLIHNDDKDITDFIFSNKNIPKFNKAYIKIFNLRMRHKNGSIVCIKAICKKEFICPKTGPTMHLTLQDSKSLWKEQDHGDFTIEFKSMMQNTNDYIYFKDRNHVFTGASQTLVSLTNPSKDWTDLLGKTDYDVFPEEYADHYYSLEKQVFSGIPVAHGIQETLDNEGKKGWVDNRKYPILGDKKEIIGLFGIARIVTESIELQNSLKQSQKKLLEANKINEQILNATGEGICGLDINGLPTFANLAAEKMLGYSLDEMKEKTQHSLIHHTKPDGSPNLIEECKIHNTFSTGQIEHSNNELFWRKNGTSFPVEYNTNPIIENGEIKGAVVSFNDISKRIEAEESLTLSENRFRKLFDESPFGVALVDSLNGKIIEANPNYIGITGMKLQELTQIDWMSITHPDDIQTDLDNMKALNEAEVKNFTMEKRLMKKDGSYIWVNLTVTPITVKDKNKPLHLAMIEDITGHKKNEEKLKNYQIHLEEEIHKRTLELKNSLQRFKSYFELPLIGVAITSPKKGWIETNQKLVDLLGYNRAELFSMTWDQLTHPDDLQADIVKFNRVLAGKLDGYSINKRFIRKDKGILYTEISVGCVRKSDGNVDYFVALINDISERIEAEKKVKETLEQLNHSEKLSTLGKFAGSVAHEFNNPLFGLISLIEQLGGELTNTNRKRFSKLAQKECWRMANMVKNLQSFYKPSDEKFSLISIETLIEEVLLIAKKALKEKKINVKKIYKTDKFIFNGIEDQIKQVILNVLENAIYSISKNDNGEITLKLNKVSNAITLEVSDTGKGIEKKNLKLIFDPFFTTKGREGTGLGLSVSYGIIKKHGGNITIDSQLGVGSNAIITLPINKKIS